MTARRHLIVGAGPVGSVLALRLADAGGRVTLVTRSGSGPQHEQIVRRAVDASHAGALAAAASGHDVVYNCANPGSYPEWEKVWPPMAASILHAAESSGAVLVTFSNLYGYGRVDGEITADLPLRSTDHKGALRAAMWRDALAAHEAGRARVTEARASDYIGPGATAANGLLAMYAASTLRDKSAFVFGDPDQPHAWTGVDDIAATLAVLGADERAWGRPWIVPTNPAVSVRAALRALGERIGAREPRLRRVPRWALAAGGVAVPLLREVVGILYQFEHPFTVDSSATTATFGLEPEPWIDLIDRTAVAWAERARA